MQTESPDTFAVSGDFVISGRFSGSFRGSRFVSLHFEEDGSAFFEADAVFSRQRLIQMQHV